MCMSMRGVEKKAGAAAYLTTARGAGPEQIKTSETRLIV